MNQLTKLLLLGIHNAFFLYFLFLPQGNFYRIARLTGWTYDFTSIAITIVCILLFIAMTITLYVLTRKLFNDRVSIAYWSMMIWIPFYVILIVLNRLYLPIIRAGENPSPVTGLLLIITWFIFPFFIGLVTSIAISQTKKRTSH
ncbi:hypothetical protein DFQ00_11673 [Paenibacillus barcinonensis]|uniref:Uncharacterized protein n=1 Tax=Paenibacillus barcinonensis TaxID=198119 RepID=A0A2V4V076_PAEBA|nr:hypothetical protein DFQ00_11673 [Paenibacillus barcinonensis]